MHADLESSKFYKFVDVGVAKFENNPILLNKINHRFLVTTRLFMERKILMSKRVEKQKSKMELFQKLNSKELSQLINTLYKKL